MTHLVQVRNFLVGYSFHPYTKDEAQQEITLLRSHPDQNPPHEYTLQTVPGLPNEIYTLSI